MIPARRLLSAACLVAALFAAIAQAQTTSTSTSTTAPAPAPAPAATPIVQDSMAQRMQACTVCHGKEGRSTNQGYFPRIAGKPAGYLYNQLVNFREGRRNNAAMRYLLEHMSDAYLRDIAGYFGALDLPYPAPQTTGAPPALLATGADMVFKGDAARGIPACSQCHGQRMTGALPAMPGLLGLPRDYIAGQIGAWQTGNRRSNAPDCMAQVARRLTATDVDAIATWLSSQVLPADAKPAAAVQAPLPLACGGLQ